MELRERVLEKLEEAMMFSEASNECKVTLGYGVVEDTLALLKAQEPKLVYVTAEISYRKIGECPNCGKLINSDDYPNYCGHCGHGVKWE